MMRKSPSRLTNGGGAGNLAPGPGMEHSGQHPDQDSAFDDDCARSDCGNENFKVRPPRATCRWASPPVGSGQVPERTNLRVAHPRFPGFRA